MNKVIGSITYAWVVLDGSEVLSVFPHEYQAKGFAELTENHNYTIKKYAAFLYEDGQRVSLFDPNATYFVYEFGVDFEPEKLHKEKELKKQALAKLSMEERKSLGF